jgi:hypothetical protein
MNQSLGKESRALSAESRSLRPNLPERLALLTALVPYALFGWAAGEGLSSKVADSLLFAWAPVPWLVSVSLLLVSSHKRSSLIVGRLALALDVVFLVVYVAAGFALED